VGHLRHFVRNLFRRDRIERELTDEIDGYLELLIEGADWPAQSLVARRGDVFKRTTGAICARRPDRVSRRRCNGGIRTRARSC
jgi:hypothetical protein